MFVKGLAIGNGVITIRLTHRIHHQMYGRSEGVLVTQRILPGKY